MSNTRLALFAALSLVCIAWSAAALYAQIVRWSHQNLIEQIRNHSTLLEPATLDAAITRYNHTLTILPCAMQIHEDLGLLLALRTDSIMQTPNLDAEADAFDAMHSALSNLLACTPTNGKAWLDLATISLYREGFTKDTAHAYVMSGKVTPVESWLAEKRLIFILPFVALLSAEEHRIIANDLATLTLAHPNRINAVMAAAKVDSKAALARLLGQPSTTPKLQAP